MPEFWKDQLTGRITDLPGFAKRLNLDPAEFEGLEERLAFSLTPYYAGLCLEEPQLLRTVLPSPLELTKQPFELLDPMLEEPNSPTKVLVHRYPNRVLFLLTPHCPVYCRYCTRSRKVGKSDQKLSRADWQEAIDWIKRHPEIEEVILSGGEPLMLSDSSLAWVLDALDQIPHVQFLRFSTKAVAVMPQRITDKLAQLFGQFPTLLLNLHFTHPKEITEESESAIKKLRDAGVMLASQTVLLMGVNEEPQVLASLFKGLYRNGVRPYALYLCDWIAGADHFRIGPSRALETMAELRKLLSGVMIPKLIADPPGGKVDIGQPLQQVEGGAKLINWKGQVKFWPELNESRTPKNDHRKQNDPA